MKPISFDYKNHRGEIAPRTIIPSGIEWIPNPGFGYQPGWFISGVDQDKKAHRSFALTHIILPDNTKHFFLFALREAT